MPCREVKHQGASAPSGFRQKFSRRSLGGYCYWLWVMAHLAHQPFPTPGLCCRVHPNPQPHLHAYFSGAKRCWCGLCASQRWQGTPAAVVLAVPR